MILSPAFLFIVVGCSDMFTAFNPNDTRSKDSDCGDSGDCSMLDTSALDDSGTVDNDDSEGQEDNDVRSFNGFSGYINQTVEFGPDYQSQGYSDCTIGMTLRPAGEYRDSGCPNCDLLGESNATLSTSCSFAENSSGTFRMGVDTANEMAYSYNDDDGWQPFFAAVNCNAGLDVVSSSSSLTLDCLYDADGYIQATKMNIRW